MALTQITEKGIKDGEILNADINASAAIAGTKISPNFGGQDVTTTGNVNGANLVLSHTTPTIQLNDSNNNPDFVLQNNNGVFRIRDNTNSADRINIDSSGNVGIGTASPLVKLHVQDSSAVQARVRSTGGSSKIYVEASDGNSASMELFEAGTGGYSLQVGNDDALMFFDDSTERMRIDSSGRVLIGLNANAANASIDDLQVGNPNSSTQTGITIGSNDEAAIAFANNGDARAGTITYNMGSDAFIFKTNGQNERMRIDSAGKIGIGNHSGTPNTRFDIGLGVFAATGDDDASDWGADNVFQLTATGGNAANNQVLLVGAHSGGVGQIASGIGFGRDSTTNWGTYLSFKTHSTSTSNIDELKEAVRIDSAGGLRVGTTGPNYDELFTITETGTNNEIATWRVNNASHNKDMVNMIHVANSGSRVMMRFRRTGSLSSVGDITTSATATSYGTTSDYRLKENQELISDGITRLKTLKPYKFNFKTDPTTTVDGFFAHEVTPAVPEAITGTKDEVDSDNNPIYQGIDQSKLVPLLTAALQEEISKREALETRVAALEAG